MKNKLFISIILVAIIILVPQFVSADALGSGLLRQSVGNIGLEESVENSVANIIKTILALTGTMFLVLTVVAGVMWMTASGNEDKISKAKKIIIGATIGLAVVLFAYTITAFIAGRLEAGGNQAPTEQVAE